MDATYLVEIRLSRTKWRIMKIMQEIARNFGIGEFLELHPHVTLFGPLTLNEGVTSRQLLDAVGRVAARYDPVPFLIDGWEKRDGMHGSVIAFPVRPSEPLRQLTRGIAEVLSPITTSQNAYDGDPDGKWFHVTIANHLGSGQASAIFAHLTGKPQEETGADGTAHTRKPGLLQRFLPKVTGGTPPRAIFPVLVDETGIRITVMENMAILAEYDLIEKRWVYGDHRHSAPRWQRTLLQYRYQAGLEHRDPERSRSDDVFVIADLHLGHSNIIRYCSRPFLFSDSSEMDHVLIKNWNYTVGPKSRIYCLGDLRYGPDAEPAPQYLKRLRGEITVIRGNHDDPAGTLSSVETEYDSLKFLLVHDPADAPPAYDGWVIHGHHHNNDLRHYPYINFAGRRVNVSAEVIGYRPVSLREIAQRIRERGASGDSLPLLFRYGGS